MDEQQAGAPRDAEIDGLLKETEVMLRHTRVFLDHLSKSEQLSRKYLEEMEGMLERELHRLHRRKDEINTSPSPSNAH